MIIDLRQLPDGEIRDWFALPHTVREVGYTSSQTAGHEDPSSLAKARLRQRVGAWSATARVTWRTNRDTCLYFAGQPGRRSPRSCTYSMKATVRATCLS